MNAPLIAAIEGGGTKFVCALGRGPDALLEQVRVATTTPAATLAAVAAWLEDAAARHGAPAAIGIGCFGPLDLDPASAAYGHITSTPKPGWQHTEIAGFFQRRFQVPVGFDTDVNAAALAEHLWGAGQGQDPLIYITVGTGMGGGVYVNGRLLHGLLHPEIGHLAVPPPAASQAPHPECQCPFHRHCVEGYVCGPAIAKRWGRPADDLPPDHPAWDEVADTLGHALMNLCLTLAPRRIILGGGVMQVPGLLPRIRTRLREHLNRYLLVPELEADIDRFIVAPGLHTPSGLVGAWALGQQALNSR